MINRLRFGELLGRMGKLSVHDIDEILQEQSATQHRFGDIALTWGLVQPEHIWKAWCEQLSNNAQTVDLNDIGIDTQATARIPGHVAHQLHIMPVRMLDDEMIVAISGPAQAEHLAAISQCFAGKLRFVFAESRQIVQAIDRYYPLPECIPA